MFRESQQEINTPFAKLVLRTTIAYKIIYLYIDCVNYNIDENNLTFLNCFQVKIILKRRFSVCVERKNNINLFLK